MVVIFSSVCYSKVNWIYGVTAMELGEKIKAARLEKGLSQRQLCGDVITRNMLSQIENGAAGPSMGTLRYLAAKLEQPLSYFLDEPAVLSPNQALMEQARNADPAEALTVLQDYRPDDPIFDREKYLLEAMCAMALAEQALRDGKKPYAAELLYRAARAGARTPYYTPEWERKRLALLYRADPDRALGEPLPDDEERLLRAHRALDGGDCAMCIGLLTGQDQPEAYLLTGRAFMEQGRYADAAAVLQKAEPALKNAVYPLLEQCFRETEDFKKAYEYACKQR